MPWGAAAAVVGSVAGGLIQGDAAKSAANTSADAQRYAADQAAAAARFTPYGVTTGFGSSNFGTDPTTGQPTASYTLNPQLQAIRDRTLSQAGSYDPTQFSQYAQPLIGGSQTLFGLANQLIPSGGLPTGPSAGAQSLQQQYANAQQGLMPTSYQTGATPGAMALSQQYQNAGQGYLAQSPEEAAQSWLTKQQNLLAPGREQELAAVNNQQYQTGRAGLAVGGTSQGYTGAGSQGLMATNPQLAALYNARAQQDAGLSSQAMTQGMNQQTTGLNFLNQGLTTQQQSEATQRNNMLQNLGLSLGYGAQGLATGTASEQQQLANYYSQLNAGTGLFGSGAAVLGQVPSLTNQAYAPLQTQLGLAGQIEGYGQSALDIGAQLGGRSATAGASVANALLTGGTNAARTQQAGNAYSPVGSVLQGIGNSSALNSWFQNTLNNSNSFGSNNANNTMGYGLSNNGATPNWTNPYADYQAAGNNSAY